MGWRCWRLRFARLDSLRDFLFDDTHNIEMRGKMDWLNIPGYFTTNQSQFYGSNLYRPVVGVWSEVFYGLFGTHAWAWHGLSILVHVGCCLLVFRLALVLLENRFAAWTAAALFAVHPAHVEAISWIAGIADPLMTFFMLASVLCFLRWMDRGNVGWWVASFAAGWACVFTKEPGVMLPVVLLATALAVRGRARAGLPVVGATIPFFVIPVVFLGVRQAVLTAFSHALVPATTAQMMYTWPAALLFYLRHMLWPSVVAPFYPLSIVESWQSRAFAVPLLVLVCACGALGWLLWKAAGWRRACACVVWMAAPLAPALYLKALAPFELVHDRFLYAPLVGFCMAVALVLQWGAERH